MAHRNHPNPRLDWLWWRVAPGSWAMVRRLRPYEDADKVRQRFALALGKPISDFCAAMTPPHDPEA